MSISILVEDGPAQPGLTPTAPWWHLKDEGLHQRLVETFRLIEQRDLGRMEDYREFYRLYKNKDILGFAPTEWGQLRTRQRATLNVIKAVINTAASRIAKQNPRAIFQTFAGNFTLQRKAKLLTRWVDAQRHTTNSDVESERAFLDACIFGSGAIHTRAEDGEACVDRVFPGELFVDQYASLHGKPMEMYRRRFVDRGILKALFPEKAAEIDRPPREGMPANVPWRPLDMRDPLADQIEVIEAWRLPSRKGAKDGRYAMIIDGVVLKQAAWAKRKFPFIFMKWEDDCLGFWGTGLADELVPIQVELNRYMGKLQKILNLCAPQVWRELSSIIKSQTVTNQIGAINTYRGTPPVFSKGLQVPIELIQHIMDLWNKAFEQTGVTQMFAGDRPPPGVDAAVAIQEVADQGSMRFSLVFKAWDRFHMQLAESLVGLGKKIKGRMVAARDRWTVDEVRWDEIDMERDSYVIRVFPASALPQSPGLRIQRIIDMQEMGWIDPATAKRLADMPDLDEEASLDSAQVNYIKRAMEAILDDGVYIPPEPQIDAQLALKTAQAWYLRASTMTEPPPESHMSLLRQWMAACQQYAEKAAMAQMAPAMMGQPGVPLPPGPAGAPPQAALPGDPMMA